ncbi:MAG TPA: O-acetyl-ADP-ribose deacetylase [Terriglobales bacterium]|nr:O-acetyl-ADP-ribose deacetylase [Terriglobales bacterium]
MTQTVRLSLGEGSTIELVEGDITRQQVDAVVNAANSSLMGGGGVDGAIHRAGGPEILEECRKIVARQGSLPPGRAVHTTAGQLPAGFVIHTVGPIWHGGQHGEPETLASCYREALMLADRLQLQNIAFPSISTGAYGYPVADAAAVALKTLAVVLPDLRHVREVRFVLFAHRDFDTYHRALESLAAHKPDRYQLIARSESHRAEPGPS